MRSLIPNFIQKQHQANRFKGQLQAVAMFVDLSGFTSLTEALMQYHKDGAETLTDILNDIFNPLVAQIYAHGGFITTFAGDGFTALFPTRRKDAPRHALQIAFFINRFITERRLIQTKYGDFELDLKIGVSVGQVQWGILGRAGRLTYYFRGEAVDACAQAENIARKGEIIAHDKFWRLVQPDVEAAMRQQAVSPGGVDFHHLTACHLALPARRLPPRTLTRADLTPFVLDEVIDLTGNAEFRDVCAIFISFVEPKSYTVLNNFASTVIELLVNYRGYFNRVSFGDKGAVMLILFGAPVAYENNLERAANFLLALQSRALGVDWRAGLTFGPVYAGIVGGEEHCEYTAMGDIVNLSARLMAAAAWHELWCGAVVYERLKEAYEFADLGAHQFKGKSGSIPVYRLLQEKEFAEATFYTGEMIGRAAELALLSEALQPLFAGNFAGIIYVYGEAGIGKSRLVYELWRQLARQQRITWFHCPAEEILQQPLNPFKYFLRRYFGQQAEVTVEQNKARFWEMLEVLSRDLPPAHPETAAIQAELERSYSLLGALVNLYWTGSLYEQLEPRLRFDNTLAAFKNLVKAESLRQPVVIELDDGHWLDSDSKELLRVLTRNVAAYPFVIVCTGRYLDDGSKFKIPLDDTVLQQEIDLNYLSATGTQALAERILQGPLAPAAVAFLSEKTNGNPFFIEQLILDLRERNWFKPDEQGQYSLAPLDFADVPSTINAVLVSRLDRLSAEVKQVVQTASVLGREFEVLILSQILRDAPGLKERIKEAEDEQMWSTLNEIRYIFKHALLRDSAYGMQLRARLRELHQLAAEAIEHLYAADLSPYYPDLAYHYEKAEITGKTVFYLQQAGEYAQANYQNEAALAFYDRLLKYPLEKSVAATIYGRKGEIFNLTGHWDLAVEMLTQGVAGAAADRDLQRAAELKVTLGDVLRRRGDYDLALAHLEQARAISEALQDKKTLGRALSIIAGTYKYKLDTDQALEFYRQALAIAEEIGDKQDIAVAVAGIGSSFDLVSDFEQALVYSLQAIPMFEELGDKMGLIYPLFNASGELFYLGNNEQSLAHFQRTIAECEEIGDREGIWFSYHYLGQIYQALGDLQKSVYYYEESLRIRTEMGNTGIPYETTPYLAATYMNLDRDVDALQMVLRHLQRIEETGRDVEQGYAHLVVALLLTKIQARSQNGKGSFGPPAELVIPPALQEVLGLISAKTQLPPNPLAYFTYALDSAGQEGQIYPYTLIQALYHYGQYLYVIQNQPETGHSQLVAAKRYAEEYRMQGELRRIEQICQELGVDFETL